jgi:hypothetical protein
VNRELAVDSQVAAAAEHTAQPHCQPNLQVQAGSEQRSIWQAREHLSGFAIAYAGNIRQHEGVAVCKNVKQLHLREYFLEHHNYMVNRWKPRWWLSLRESFAPQSAQRFDEAPKLDSRLGSGTLAAIAIPLAFRRAAPFVGIASPAPHPSANIAGMHLRKRYQRDRGCW